MKRVLVVVMPGWRDQRGVALPLALMVMAILGTMSAAILSIGSSEVQISGNHLRATQTHFVAEAGLEDAFNSLRKTPTLIFAATTAPTNVAGLAGPGANLAAFGTYTVQYQRAGGNTVQVVSEGTSAAGGARKVLRATLSNAYTSNEAILINDDLAVSSSMGVYGSCASAHANGKFTVSGNSFLDGNATASKRLDVKGSLTVGGIQGEYKPIKPVPAINPADFLAAAKATLPPGEIYQLKEDGRVLDGNGNLVGSTTSGGNFRGWKKTANRNEWGPAKFDYIEYSPYDGTYYIEGSAMLTTQAGKVGPPWRTSILAEGNIEVSGNPKITNHLTDTLFVAGMDLKINGNTEQTFKGIMAAREQVAISGNPKIHGYIIGEGRITGAKGGLIDENEISGELKLTYDCDLKPPLAGALAILAWGL